MKCFILFLAPSIFIINSSCSQPPSTKSPGNERVTGSVGGNCEGCEAIYESPLVFEKLEHIAWLPDWKDKGTKLVVQGVVYKPDGKTPAAGVVIYVYHTDQNGVYAKKGNETGWGKRHGYIRGWMRTNEKGEYRFTTLKPIAYPNSKIPAHIHVTIKEPGMNEYWIDEFVFDDDPFLTMEERHKNKNRGGDGILIVTLKEDILEARRNIYLGKNIPNYLQQ